VGQFPEYSESRLIPSLSLSFSLVLAPGFPPKFPLPPPLRGDTSYFLFFSFYWSFIIARLLPFFRTRMNPNRATPHASVYGPGPPAYPVCLNVCAFPSLLADQVSLLRPLANYSHCGIQFVYVELPISTGQSCISASLPVKFWIDSIL